ncbi:MAG: TobH protein [Mycobacteriaceae bacterium]|nr:TobH protein [Mycobacteriaceae bacterium]
MNATRSVIDLDDSDGLITADRDGLLRAASTAGAHVRAVASSVAEGALESLAGPLPRTVIWVAGRGSAATAGRMLAALLSPIGSAPIMVAAATPPWIGPLDVVVVAGDDPGDPVLAATASMAARRGARVVVAAPFEGPLRDAAAGRAAVLEPRLPLNDAFGLSRYLAAGLAALSMVDDSVRADVAALADEVDAEVLRSSAGREIFTNPAKALAGRMDGRRVVLAADSAAVLALAQHGSSTLLRVAGTVAAAAGLADVVSALQAGITGAVTDSIGSLFHDEQIDGPSPDRLRVLALTLNDERPVVAARTAGLDDVDLVGAEDIPDAVGIGIGSADAQLAVLAVRLEMTAVYLRLIRG